MVARYPARPPAGHPASAAIRRPPPVRWLMTDERLGARLWSALRRLPPGSGVVFRHHATPPAARRALFVRVRRVARARGLLLVTAGAAVVAGGPRHGRTAGAYSAPVHDRAEARGARRAGAHVAMVSPVFATRSHPGAPPLGIAAAARIARDAGGTAIALGGMNERRWRRIARFGFAGWAAIDAWG